MLRKHYIVKPRLQVKYLLIALFVVCVTALAVYYAFWSSMVRSPGLEQLSSGELMALERAYKISFGWVVLILAAGIGLESIFLFHRLVGPVFVFERILKTLAAGDFTPSVCLRRGDELKDTAATMQAMIANVRTAVGEDRAQLEQARRLLAEGKAAEAREALAGLTKWFTIP